MLEIARFFGIVIRMHFEDHRPVVQHQAHARNRSIDSRTSGCTVERVKSIPISDLRQRVADVIDDVQTTDEPTVVMQRSRKAAYIVNPERYERDQAELSALRRAVFLVEVREAEAEYQAGEARRFDDVEQLLDELRG